MITEAQVAKEREPIPYTKVKRLRRGLLYVMKVVRSDPIIGYGKPHDEYSVIDLRGWRKGYEPRLEIVGEYTPNPNDLFRLGTGRLPPYQPVATGDKLQAEMERLNVYKAWRIGYPELHKPAKGEQAGMLGAPGKYVEQKRPWAVGQMGFESYAKYIEAMDRKYSLAELKQLCRQRGLTTSGDKKTLVRRLF